MSDPAGRHVEVELTFEVDAETSTPDWRRIGLVASVGDTELRMLDARYFDTAALTLAQAGVALRRRTGGPDAGWHIKGPLVDGARTELSWPLDPSRTRPSQGSAISDDAVPEIPGAVREELATFTTDALVPIARIRNERHASALFDGAGEVIAEFVDDHVQAADLRDGRIREWREWEIELAPAAADAAEWREAFFAEVTRLATAAGARATPGSSKLGRALGA